MSPIIVMFFVLVAALAFAFWTGEIARKKGRSKYWFLVGLIYGPLGVILISALPNLRKLRQRRREMIGIAQLLKDVLCKLEMPARETDGESQGYGGQANARGDSEPDVPQNLEDAIRVLENLLAEYGLGDMDQRTIPHDSALRLDPMENNVGTGMVKERTWFYRARGKDEGPICQHKLEHKFASQELPDYTMVWGEHMEKACRAYDVPEFARLM